MVLYQSKSRMLLVLLFDGVTDRIKLLKPPQICSIQNASIIAFVSLEWCNYKITLTLVLEFLDRGDVMFKLPTSQGSKGRSLRFRTVTTPLTTCFYSALRKLNTENQSLSGDLWTKKAENSGRMIAKGRRRIFRATAHCFVLHIE